RAPVWLAFTGPSTPEIYALSLHDALPISSWPWVLIAKPLGQPLDDFPNVARWRAMIKQRPAVQAGVDLGKELRRSAPPSDEERRDRKSTRLNSSHSQISYAVFCLKKKNNS